jgi:imidazolonepropionase-like amidohydrolase
VSPGFFDAMSQLGLTEIGAVNATNDFAEIGEFNPQLYTATAVNHGSEHLPVARANGITHAGAAPGATGGFGGSTSLITGQVSVIGLSGWTVEEMLIAKTVGVLVNWPTMSTASFDFGSFSFRTRPFADVRNDYDKKVATLRDFLQDARRYVHARDGGQAIETDLRFEALRDMVAGKVPAIVRANSDRDIRNAVEFFQQEKIRLIIAGGDEAWKVKDLLARQHVPVILGPTLSLPESEDEPYDKPLARVGELHKAGVKVALSTFSSSDSRTLPAEVGASVPYGMPWEDALKAITRYPAEIFGLADRIGTLEPGKIANLVVTNGDPLELRTTVVHVFVFGQPVTLANRHLSLYELYRSRPRPAPAR